MINLNTLLYIVAAVGLASAGNAVSAVWASGENKFSVWLLVLLIISPLVFISFGLVTAKVGLTVAAGTVDALLTATTIVIGLIVFREWSRVSSLQYVGIALSMIGICLMLFFPKPSA
jgi:hypothetical protein